MSKNRDNRTDRIYNRRNILRSAGAAGASMTLAGVLGTASAATSCHLPDQSEQSSVEDSEWKRSNSDYYVSSNDPLYRLTEIQSGLVYKGSSYDDAINKWLHHFQSFGAGYALQQTYPDGEYEPTASISHQELKISNNNESMAAIFVSPNPTQVGAAPSPGNGDDLDFGSAAWTVALAALSGTSTYAAVGIPAAQAFAALLDNDEPGSNGPVTYPWSYGMDNAPCESVHFAKYSFKSLEGEHTCNFSVRQEIGQYSGLWVMNEYDVFVNPLPYDPRRPRLSNSDIESDDDRPKPGTPEYTDFLERTNAATKVPFDDIEDSRIRKLSEGGPIYRARNPSVKVVERSDGGESAEK